VGSPKPRRPILVTGVPRSGTTWLARLLAAAPHTSMPGREPMNPRGRQFALGGAIDAWVRRETFPPHEAAVIRRCYAGREPRTFSRFGLRQWAAPLPSTRVVVKDPFAVLSIGAVHDVADAVPVLLYRHPAAVLASYRRMGWTADADEMVALGGPKPAGDGDLAAMAAMWSWCHQIALRDLDRIGLGLVVSHHAMTVGGAAAHRALCSLLDLDPPPAVGVDMTGRERREGVLHDFARSTDAIEEGWRDGVTAEEIAVMDELVGSVWAELEHRQAPVVRGPSTTAAPADRHDHGSRQQGERA
jgi:hypothetical protein